MTPLPAVGVIARYLLLGAALGVPAGLAWVLLAPRVAVAHGDGGFIEPYPQGFAIADLTLALALLVAGLVLGGVAARRLRQLGFGQGGVQVVGVIIAAGMCAAVARVLGWWLAGRSMVRDGAIVELPLTLQANGVLLMAAFSALLVVILSSAFARDPESDEEADIDVATPVQQFPSAP
ncbi:MAG: hypothetical protein V9E82_15835 [Candidatus Nanopelagicales bacterium]